MVVVSKSSVVLDVKPHDDETDLVAMEDAVRPIKSDGLEWQRPARGHRLRNQKAPDHLPGCR